MKIHDVKKYFKVFLENYSDSVEHTHVELTPFENLLHGNSRFCRLTPKGLPPQLFPLKDVTSEMIDSICGTCCTSLGLVYEADTKNYYADMNFPLISVLECIEDIDRFNNLRVLKDEMNVSDFLKVLTKEQFLFTEILMDVNYFEEGSSLVKALNETNENMWLMFKALRHDENFMAVLKEKAVSEITDKFLSTIKGAEYVSDETYRLFMDHFSESKTKLEEDLMKRTSWVVTNYNDFFNEKAWLYLFTFGISKFGENIYYTVPSLIFEALPKGRIDGMRNTRSVTVDEEVSKEVLETFSVLVKDVSETELDSARLQELLEVAEKV